MGGQLSVAARTVSPTCPADQVQVTITGVDIPADEITQELVGLYQDGATPRLMTGIAQVESGYRHFCIPGQTCLGGQSPIYGRTDFWPHESHDGGSHIGLMQIDLADFGMQGAWSWLANAQAAVALFRNKLDAAARIEPRIRARHITARPLGVLRALTGVERENVAVQLYGPYATPDLTRQYYVPECRDGFVIKRPNGLRLCNGGTWEWIVNTAGNSDGVAYANSVRASMR